MAKRDIPEVNAGSMADIAFLLLIFFLVTTTMDKDTAYLRTIPAPVKVDKPIEYEKKNILTVKVNQENQFFIRGKIFDNPDLISEEVTKFYKQNRASNLIGQIFDNGYPLYFYTELSSAKKELDEAIERKSKLKAKEGDIYNRTMEAFLEADKKFNAFKLYGGPIPTISGEAHVRLEVKKSTPYRIFAKIQSEIEEAVFALRDEESKRLFNEGYGALSRKAEANIEDKESAYKIYLLEFLFPQSIVEVSPKS
jgi:biopolymer transport protein ExbD